MTLQTLHDYSDRETAEAVRCDLRWKVARGLALDDAVAAQDTITQLIAAVRRDGYRAHLVAEPGTGMITDEELAQAADPTGRVRSWFADSAYGTGDLRAAIAAAGHRAVIKPKPLQVAVEGGFSVDDFTVEEQAGPVTCPNQITRPISPGRVATFGVATRGGRRLKLRYRDTLKNNAWLKRRTAALNLRNLMDHVNGTWIVATT